MSKDDLWARVRQLRQEAFNLQSASSRTDPRSSSSSDDLLELRLWTAIDECEVKLTKLVTELEKMLSNRAQRSK